MNKIYHVNTTNKHTFKSKNSKSNNFDNYKKKFKELKTFDIEKFKKISNVNTFLELFIGFGTSLFIKKILDVNEESIECLLISNYLKSKDNLDKFIKGLSEDDIAKYLKC